MPRAGEELPVPEAGHGVRKPGTEMEACVQVARGRQRIGLSEAMGWDDGGCGSYVHPWDRKGMQHPALASSHLVWRAAIFRAGPRA